MEKQSGENPLKIYNKIVGCILGTAIGDSIGLPREGLSPARAARIFGMTDITQNFIFGYGMVSDDTEHTIMVAQSLIESGAEPDLFAKCLSKRIKRWFLQIPAGIGWATLRSGIKLILGWNYNHSGVMSAGNGPAMRSAIIGVSIANDELRDQLVRISTRMTHIDDRALEGALLVARWASLASRNCDSKLPIDMLEDIANQTLRHPAWSDPMRMVFETVRQKMPSSAYIQRCGLEKGVSGYIVSTIAAAAYCWLSNISDFRASITAVMQLGGDTDTVGAIVGGLAGAHLGESGVPSDWLDGLIEWPRSVSWMQTLSERLAELVRNSTSGQPPSHLPVTICRNAVFTSIIILHGFRRLFPPY